MDEILAKHLTKALLLANRDINDFTKNYVTFESLESDHLQVKQTEEDDIEQVIRPVVKISNQSSTSTGNVLDYFSKNSKDRNKDSVDDFFSSLEEYKDDPRVKKLFNYHSDLAKKELLQITERFTQQQMARAMESGGGTNAVQYANGGVMRGDLVIDGNLRVTGRMNEGVDSNDVTAKKIFHIGDNTLREYTVSHNLNTKDIVVSLYSNDDEQIFASIKNISLNETKISFSNPISTNSVKVVIIG